MDCQREDVKRLLSGTLIYPTRVVGGTPERGSASYPYPPVQFQTLFDEFPEARLLETPIDEWDPKSDKNRIQWGEQTFTFWNIVFETEEDMLAYELAYGDELGLKEGCKAIVTIWDYF